MVLYTLKIIIIIIIKECKTRIITFTQITHPHTKKKTIILGIVKKNKNIVLGIVNGYLL
jgi:hypothetical protein